MSTRVFLIVTSLLLAFGVAPSKGLAHYSPDLPAVNSVKSSEGAAGESRYATLDGLRIHYVNHEKDKATPNEALVLIHGWTCNVDHWRYQVGDFAQKYRVLAIDLPGHGKSDKPKITYNMDLFARAVDAVMRDAKVQRAVLAGHSMGTPVARQFYRKYPDKTLGIVIVDGALKPFFDSDTMNGLLAGIRSPQYKDTINQMFSMMQGGLSSEELDQIKATSLNTPHHVIVSAMEGMDDPSIWKEDPVKVPVLAVMAKSPMFPPDIVQIYERIAPGVDFVMWDDVGHFLMIEKPQRFNEVVLAFLEKRKLLTQ